MVTRRLEQMREDRARLERITDRGVQAGDVLIAENQVVMEGEEDPTPARRQLIQVGNNIPGFDDAVIGMMPGDERTFELTYPEDFDEEDKRGKKAAFTVKLASISAKRLPELNDDFAKQAADVETVDELRNTLRERMEAEYTRLSDQVAEQRLIEQIVTHSVVHFPAVLVREDVEDELRRLGAELNRTGLTYEQYLTQIGQTPESHQEQLRQQSEARVRTILVLRQIAEQEGLQAEEADIDAEFDRMLNEEQITEDQYEEFQFKTGRRLQVANALIQQRLHDFLFANNTITDVSSPADSEEELAEAEAEATEPGQE